MSDRKDLSIYLPEWYRMELETQKTMLRLSRVQELEFYLNHPDEYIRHQAILRLGQLRNKEALGPLNKIIDDPLEITINREIAAWVLKSTGLVGNNDYYIGNQYLDHYTGNEKLKDFYYPGFIEDRTKPEYHFGSSGIEALLLEETLLIRAESLEEITALPFSLGRWFKAWAGTKLEILRKGPEVIGKRSAAVLSGLIRQITHPEKKPAVRKQKQLPRHEKKVAADMKPVHAANADFQADPQTIALKPLAADVKANPEFSTEPSVAGNKPVVSEVKEANAELLTVPPMVETKPLASDVKVNPEFSTASPTVETKPLMTDIKAVNAAVSHEPVLNEFHHAGSENKPGYYMKPFALKSSPEGKVSRKLRAKSKIYVRGKSRDLSFSDAVKGIAVKLLKIILLPFVILWNQKVVFLTLIVCLYLFFTFVPFGRMLFYRRSPELAKINDKAVKTAQIWVTEKVAELKEMASEYELVRDIQKRMATETQEPKTKQEPVKYIVTSKTLNLRKAPGTQSEKLLVLEQNMIVEFLNQSMDIEEGKTWLYIQAPDGTVGWSFAGYLKKLEGGIEAYEGK